MILYLAKRLASSAIVLWVIVSLTFLLMHAIPGGPFTAEKKLPPQVKASIEATYHLQDPLSKQYVDYLSNLSHLDLGPSFQYAGRTVNDIIAESFPVSAQLGLASLVVALVGGIAFGVASAWKPNSIIDYGVTIFSTLGISVPTFIIGALLVYVFGFVLPIFPVALWKGPSYMVLPVLTMAAQPMAFIARLVRTELVEINQKEYIRTA
ncbi:MAG: ABC transporter permease, partial [Veillonella sp.]|nr:ABC transporter permease [Veillonella sp.]